MLPPFIIDQIRHREELERRRQADQPRLELPQKVYRPEPESREDETPADDRGVVILEIA
jgi:hypothetical protein